MRKLLSFSLAALSLFLCAVPAQAEQYKEFDQHVVHYIAFNSMNVNKKVLNTYGFQRAPNRVLINISVQPKDKKPNTWGVEAKVTGKASNLNDQQQDLNFKKIKEGDAVYYLASIRVANQEQFRFSVDIVPEDTKQSLNIKFEEKFFVDY